MAIRPAPYTAGAPSRRKMSSTAKQGARDLQQLALSHTEQRAVPARVSRPARFEYDDDDVSIVSVRSTALFAPEETQQVARHVPCGTTDFEPPHDDPFWERVDPYSVTALQSRALPHHLLDKVYAKRRHVSLLGLYSLARLDRRRVASFSAPIPYSLPFTEQWVLSAVVVAKSEPRWTQGSAGPSTVPELGQELIQESNPLIDSDDEALDRALKAAHDKSKCKPTVRKDKNAKQRRFFVVTMRDLRRGPEPLMPLEPQGGREPGEEIHLMLFEADFECKAKVPGGSVQPSEYDTLVGGSKGAFEKLQALPLGSVVALVSPRILPFRVGDRSNTLTLTPSGATSVLHLGQAADYGQCEARKSDQRKCRKFVDKRRLASASSAVVCTLHQGLAMDRLRVERPELAPAGRFAPGQAKNSYHRVKEQDPWEVKDIKPKIASASVAAEDRRQAAPKPAKEVQYPVGSWAASSVTSELRPSFGLDEEFHWPSEDMYLHGSSAYQKIGSSSTCDQSKAEDWEAIFRSAVQRKGRAHRDQHGYKGNAGDKVLSRMEQAELHESHRKHAVERVNFQADPTDEGSHLYDVQTRIGRGKAELKAVHEKRLAQDDVAKRLDRPRSTLRRYDNPDDEVEQVQLAADAYDAERAKGDQLTLYRSLGPSAGAATEIMERAHSLIDTRREQNTTERKRKRELQERVRRAAKKPARGALSMSSSEPEPEPEDDATLPNTASSTGPHKPSPYRLQTSMMRQIGFDPFAGKPVRLSSGGHSSRGEPSGNDAVSRLLARTISSSSSRSPQTAAPSLKRPARPQWRNVRPPVGAQRTAKQQVYDGLYGLDPDELSDLDLSDGLEL